VSNIQKRGSYTPRRTREQRAYRLVVAGGVSGAAGAVGLLLALVGVWGATIPVLLLVVAVVCGLMFRGLTSK
jgi:CHASE2 domain-containing sensor protein